MRIRTLVLVATTLACSALSCSSESSPSTAGAASNVTKPVGPEGATIEVGGAVVTIPKGALAATTNITIAAEEATAVPEGFVSLSKLFKCEPSGTDFAVPVEMRMPFTDDGKGGTLFWSTGADPSFQDLGGKVEGATMVATVRHFSSGFVGRKK